MLCVQSIGPRMMGYLEIIGIERLADLRGQNAGEIAVRINTALWRDHITCQWLRALKSLIDHAEQQT